MKEQLFDGYSVWNEIKQLNGEDVRLTLLGKPLYLKAVVCYVLDTNHGWLVGKEEKVKRIVGDPKLMEEQCQKVRKAIVEEEAQAYWKSVGASRLYVTKFGWQLDALINTVLPLLAIHSVEDVCKLTASWLRDVLESRDILGAHPAFKDGDKEEVPSVLIVDLPDHKGELTCCLEDNHYLTRDGLMLRSTSGQKQVDLLLTLSQARQLRDWLIAQDMGGLTMNVIKELVDEGKWSVEDE